MPVREDIHFGGEALRRRWLTQRQLHRAVRELERCEAEGRRRAMSEVLVQMGYLDRRQAVEILEEMKVSVVRCARCGSERYEPGRAADGPMRPCETCGGAMVASRAVPETDRALPVRARRASRARLPERADGLEGLTVGPFHILEKLGGGGMGVVYRARNAVASRQVALKVMSPGPGGLDETAVQRFLHEGRSVAALQHRHIARVYDVGKLGRLCFIEMQYVEGRTLGDVLRVEGRLGVGAAVTVAAQALTALAFAHGQGLVHRDIKPDNILLTRSGEVRVTDFGLAKDLLGGPAAGAGLVTGTPWYMSPEQCRGEPVDGRCDLYALGLTLFETLAGERAFDGTDPMAVMRMQEEATLRGLRRLRPDVPAAVERFIRRLAAKDRRKRYASAAAALEALEGLGAGEEGGEADLAAAVARVLRVLARPAPGDGKPRATRDGGS